MWLPGMEGCVTRAVRMVSNSGPVRLQLRPHGWQGSGQAVLLGGVSADWLAATLHQRPHL